MSKKLSRWFMDDPLNNNYVFAVSQNDPKLQIYILGES